MHFNHFNLTFDATKGGITSLKRVADQYDTDYILADAALGEVIVRYRLGQGAWQELADRKSVV